MKFSPLQDMDSSKILASSSIRNNDYNTWVIGCLGRDLRCPSAVVFPVLLSDSRK